MSDDRVWSYFRVIVIFCIFQIALYSWLSWLRLGDINENIDRIADETAPTTTEPVG